MGDLQLGLQILVIGLAVVFAALFGLMLVIELAAKILNSNKETESVEEVDSKSKDELVAVVSAVMAAVGVDKNSSIRIVKM